MNNANTASDQIMLINPGRNQLQKELSTILRKRNVRLVPFSIVTGVRRDQDQVCFEMKVKLYPKAQDM